jgi:hypothetical protein
MEQRLGWVIPRHPPFGLQEPSESRPRPSAQLFHRSRHSAHRIEVDVVAQRPQVRPGLDQQTLVAPLEPRAPLPRAVD